jgi:MinD superfamily P-loop ATPase
MSGKGGVGKTTVAVSFATHMARRGGKVLLADLDVEEPNAGLFLEKQLIDSADAVVYRPQWKEDLCILCGKCQGFCAFNAIAALPKYVIVFPELCHSCYACSELCPASALPMIPVRIGQIQQYSVNEHLVFIEGRLDIGQEIASILVRQTRDKALQEAQAAGMQWLVFDAAPGTACASREAMIKSDAVILVTEPTPFGLHDMSLAFRMVKASGKPCAIVVNKDSPGYAGIEQFAREEQVPIIARIPYNSELAQSYSVGSIPTGAFPALEDALSRIASWLLEVSTGGQP